METLAPPGEDFLKMVAQYRLDPRHGRQELGSKTIVPVVGAACIGKTTVIDYVAKLNPNFHAVQTLTTRPPSPRDDGHMRYLPHTEQGFQALSAKMQEQEIVQIARHPSTGYFYATEVSDFPQRYNILPVLSSAISMFQSLPFGDCVVIALSAKEDEWHKRFKERYPLGPEINTEGLKRIDEARQSLDWSLNGGHHEIMWITNLAGQARGVAEQLIDAVRDGEVPGNNEHHNARKLGEKMYASIDELEQQYLGAA